jgi:amidase
MTTPEAPAWQQLATAKREAIFGAIPSEWRLASVPSVQEQVDVTTWIEQFFSPREREITACSAAAIAAKTCAGAWSAEEVARAFCHRAAVAHQLVCV